MGAFAQDGDHLRRAGPPAVGEADVALALADEEEPLVGPDDLIVIDQSEFEKDYEVR